MDQKALIPLAVTAAAVFAAYKFGPAWAKAMALGVAGVVVAKHIPIVQDAVC